MKKRIFYLLVVLFSAYYVLLLSGLLGVAGNHGIGDDGSAHLLHIPAAIIFIGFIASGLISQLPGYGRYRGGFQQVAASLLGLLLMAFIVGDPDNHGGNNAIFDPAFLLFIVPVVIMWFIHPDRRNVFSIYTGKAHRGMLALYLTLLVPFSAYGVQQALLQRNSFPPLSDIHHQHWQAMAMVAFSTVLIGIVGALKSRGYVLPSVSASVSLLILGFLSILYPEAPSSLGVLFGAVSFAAGLLSSYWTASEISSHFFTRARRRRLFS